MVLKITQRNQNLIKHLETCGFKRDRAIRLSTKKLLKRNVTREKLLMGSVALMYLALLALQLYATEQLSRLNKAILIYK